MRILTTQNQKLLKGSAKGWVTAGVHFAPANLSGHNVCPMASQGCKLACLNTSGHGRYQRIQNVRIAKTKRFFENRNEFMAELITEIETVIRRAKKNGMRAAFRLNLTSDVQWENIKYQDKTVFEMFPDVQFYDYTKIAKRFFRPLPTNYHLTFSRSESNEALCELVLKAGGNVAVVFADKLPKTYKGYKVVNGDETDLRFLDKKNVIVGLTPKGKAKKDESGFVVKE